MYAIYKQTHPPTGVEHCVHCHFVSSVESNLIVAGTSQLRIYKFYAQDEVRVTILLLRLDIMLLCLLLLIESDKSVRHTPPTFNALLSLKERIIPGELLNVVVVIAGKSRGCPPKKTKKKRVK